MTFASVLLMTGLLHIAPITDTVSPHCDTPAAHKLDMEAIAMMEQDSTASPFDLVSAYSRLGDRFISESAVAEGILILCRAYELSSRLDANNGPFMRETIRMSLGRTLKQSSLDTLDTTMEILLRVDSGIYGAVSLEVANDHEFMARLLKERGHVEQSVSHLLTSLDLERTVRGEIYDLRGYDLLLMDILSSPADSHIILEQAVRAVQSAAGASNHTAAVRSYHLARLHHYAGDGPAARNYLSQAISAAITASDTDFPWYKVDYFIVFPSEDWKKFRDQAASSGKTHPAISIIRFHYVEALLNERKTRQAADEIRRQIIDEESESRPAGPEYLVTNIMHLSELGYPEIAVAFGDSLLSHYKLSGAFADHLFTILAYANARMGNTAQSMRWCDSIAAYAMPHVVDSLRLLLLGEVIGDYHGAIELKERQINKLDNPTALFDAHLEIGRYYQALDQFSRALEHYRIALECEPDRAEDWVFGAGRGRAAVHDRIGQVLTQIGRESEAILSHQEAILIRRGFELSKVQELLLSEIKVHPGLIISYLGVAEAYRKLNDTRSAAMYTDSAYNLPVCVGVGAQEWWGADVAHAKINIMREIAWKEAARGNMESAVLRFDSYTREIEKSAGDLDLGTAEQRDIYRRSVREWCAFLRTRGSWGIEKSLEYEARLLDVRLRSLRLAAASEEERADLARVEGGQAKAQVLERKLAAGDPAVSEQNVREAWNEASQEWLRFLREHRGYEIRTPDRSLWRLLSDTEAFVRFVIEDSSTVVYLVTRTATRFYENPEMGKAELRARIEAFRNNIWEHRSVNSDSQADARELFQSLFGDLAPIVRSYTRIHLHPDGALFHLPFEALDAEESGPYRPWLERAEIDIVATLERSRSVPTSADSTLVYAAPTVSDLPELISASIEGAVVADVAAPSVLRTRDEATEASFRRDLMSGWKVIHFACHATAQGSRAPAIGSRSAAVDKSLLENCVMLSATGSAAGEDGRLTLAEIQNLSPPSAPDLVVLSACETAMGTADEGLEIISLADAFYRIGVRHVVATLWEVHDEFSAQLMAKFYELRQKGYPDESALTLAKRDMLRFQDGRFANPAYWSPFVLYRPGW